MRRLRWVTGVVIGAGALYLISANVFLSTSLADRAINRKPEKLLVGWDRAWTVLPGVVHVRGLTLRAQNTKAQWTATFDRGTLGIRFWLLPGKRFSVSGARAEGLRLRIRRRWDTMAAEPLSPDAWPPIDGLANPPREKPEVLHPVPEDPLLRWRLDFEGIRIADVREIWLDRFRLTGTGSLGGNLRFHLRHSLRADAIDFRWSDGRLAISDQVVAEEFEADWRAEVAPHLPREVRGREFLSFVSGRYDLSGRVATLAFFEPHLGRPGGVTVDGGGLLSAELHVTSGRLDPPSRLEVDATRLRLEFLDYAAEGAGHARVWVANEDPPTTVEITLDRFALERAGIEAPYAEGETLRTTVRAPALSLHERLEDFDLRVEIPRSRVPDLSVYDAFLPAKLELRLAGSGELNGQIHIAGSDETTMDGNFVLASDALSLSNPERGFTGALRIETKIQHAPEDGYDVSGSRLTLADVRPSPTEAPDDETPPWQGALELVEGRITAGSPLRLTGRAHSTLADTAPMIALLARENLVIDWFESALTVRDVRADASIDVGSDRFSLTDLSVVAENLEILGDLSLQPAPPEGLLFLRLGKLSAAVDIADGDRNWKLLGSRAWFEERYGARSGPAPPTN